jgi:hypothetical protein
MSREEGAEPLLEPSPDSPRRVGYTVSRQNRILVNYDPFRSPPDLGLAEAHGVARRTARPVFRAEERCPCCHLALENEPIPFRCDLPEMAHLGVAFPLYFDYTKLAFLLLSIHLSLSGVASLAMNAEGSQCAQMGNRSIICTWSVLNILNADQLYYLKVQNVLNCVFVLLALLLIEAFHVWQDYQQGVLLAELVLPEDFAVTLKGLPIDCTVESIQLLVQEELQKAGVPTTVCRIHMLFDMKTFSDLYSRKAELHGLLLSQENALTQARAALMAADPSKHKSLQEDVDEAKEEIEDYQAELNEIDERLIKIENCFNKKVQALVEGEAFDPANEVLFSGKAIVILSDAQAVQALADRWRPSFKQKAIMKGKWSACFFSKEAVNEFKYKGKYLSIKQGHAPSDILWANVGSAKGLKTQTRALAWVCISLAMMIDFLVLTLLKRFIKVEQGISISSLWNLILSFASSVICCGFNTLLGIVIRYFARNEIYNLKSVEFASVCERLTLVFMLNMVFATFFSNVVSFFLTSPVERATYSGFPLNFEGLVNDFFFLFITNSYMSSIFNFFDIVWGFRLYKRHRIRSGQLVVSQAEANVTLEGHPVDMALRYANIKKTILFTGAVAPLLPVGLPLSLLALVINYAVDKYLLLTRFVCHNRLGANLSRAMMGLLYWYVVLLALCNLLVMFIPAEQHSTEGIHFEAQFDPTFFYLALLVFLLALGFRYAPTRLVRRGLCWLAGARLGTRRVLASYEDAKKSGLLFEDYEDFTPFFSVRLGEEGQPVERRGQGVYRQDHSLMDMVRGYLNSKQYNIDE